MNLTEILREDFLQSKRKVNRYLVAGFTFGLVGLIFILEPYFHYKKQEIKVREAQKLADSSLAEVSQRVNKLDSIGKITRIGLSRIQKRIDRYPQHLREKITVINEILANSENGRNWERTSTQTQQFRSSHWQDRSRRLGEFQLPDSIQKTGSAINWYVQNWFKGLMKDLDKNVTEPVLGITSPGESKTQPGIEKLVHQAQSNVKEYLVNLDPEFWRSYDRGKVPASEGLQEVVDRSFGKVRDTLFQLINQAELKADRKKKQVEQLQQRNKQILAQSKKLSERISDLDSPLGKLPVGIQELIVIFPFLVFLFGVLFSRSVTSALKQRFIFRKEMIARDPAFPRHRIHLYASAWFLPGEKGNRNPALIKWAVCMTVFLVVFIRSSQLVGTGHMYLTSGPSEGNLMVIQTLASYFPWIILGAILSFQFIQTSRDMWIYTSR